MTVNVALLGYGLAGRYFHAPIISAVSGLSLTAVVTTSTQRRQQAQRDWPGVEVQRDLNAVRARHDVHLVVVATPNRSHLPLGLASIAAGIAVVIDKPLAGTADEARALCDAADAAGVLLTVFHNRRWDSDVLTAAQLLADGVLGEPLRLETRFERWRPETGSGWRDSADPQDGGGLLLDLGSHQADQAMHLLGPVAAVYAELDTRRADAAVEDDVMLALTHTNGARSTHWLSATAAHQGPRMRLLGSRAAYVAEHMDTQEEALRAGQRPGLDWGTAPDGVIAAGETRRRVPNVPGDYRRFYEQVAVALTGHGPVPVQPRDGLAVLEVLDAARLSASTEQVVRLPP